MTANRREEGLLMHAGQVIWLGKLCVLAIGELILRTKALFLNTQIENFHYSVGWLYCFRARKDIGIYSVSSE
jgi:hypothetical protein